MFDENKRDVIEAGPRETCEHSGDIRSRGGRANEEGAAWSPSSSPSRQSGSGMLVLGGMANFPGASKMFGVLQGGDISPKVLRGAKKRRRDQ